ncbi:Rv3235 family protein [Actinokineospora guangxiensis]|uniref:Rv3235 family protein n=1 Tax=Actinokineospora guangxiensis TaxID=1490288 RepID=A0ABW0EX28_9PSEU
MTAALPSTPFPAARQPATPHPAPPTPTTPPPTSPTRATPTATAAPTPAHSAPVTPLPATSTPGRRQLARLVVLLAEALAGRRPHAQLAPLLTYPVQNALRVLPRQPRDLRVRSVHLCQVDRRTVEIAATVTAGPRAKALAARAEHTAAGWRLTAVHVVGR